ncbi:MAG: flagellar hook-basal body complex protein FliE [Parvibaculaceae bacterium]
MLNPIARFGATLDTLGTQGVGQAQPLRPSAAPVAQADFGRMLAEVANEGVQTLRQAEFSSLQSIRGKASVQEVVDAVMAAEQTLQAAIAVRDKMVSAYQELTRMAI